MSRFRDSFVLMAPLCRYVTIPVLMISSYGMGQSAFKPLPGMQVSASGDIQFEDLHVSVVHFSDAWRCTRQGTRGAVVQETARITPTAWLLKGAFCPAGGVEPFSFSQEMRSEKAGQFSYQAHLTHPSGVPSNTLALAIRLPVRQYDGRELLVDGKALRLEPKTFENAAMFENVKCVSIPTGRGYVDVEGSFEVLVQDGRGTQHPFYRIRVMFSQSRGLVKDASLELRFRLREPSATFLDLSAAANMGFRDETEGDRKGGWTDQGNNDIRMLKPGRHVLGSIPMLICDPKQNGGRSCLVFAGPQREYFLDHAEIPSPPGSYEALYLLHATAWTPPAGTSVGDVRMVYSDGSAGKYTITVCRDVANWFQPVDLDNGAVVWSDANPRSAIGLFMTRIPLEDRPLARIEFVPSKKAVWMVVAASVGEKVPVWVPAKDDYIFPDEQWRPITHHVFTEPGSILDFSGLVAPGPAGRDGPIVVRNGHFEALNREGAPIRFFGANVCSYANYQDREEAERLAAELVRKGYNSARLHHYGAILPRRGTKCSTDFDSERRDQIDYFFSCLKNAGIYITIDLYTTRTVYQGEIPEVDRSVRLNEFKALMAVSPAAMANWKTYATYVLTHKNTYTGLAWKDDPALFGICLVNEGNLSVHWDTAPDIAKLYLEKYGAWLIERQLTIEEAPAGTSPAWTEFITNLNRDLTRECMAHVKSLGTVAQITDVNYRQILPSYLIRDDLDYVDNHNYWDLKKFLAEKWKLPYGFRQLSNTACAAYTPRLVMPTRHFGKPFMVTEFNYCYPNHFRAEGGPLMGAYAALQGWDGIYRYTYSHSAKRTQELTSIFYLDNVSDPINMLSDRIASLLFLRGDVKQAGTRVPFFYNEELLKRPGMLDRRQGHVSDGLTRLGLLYQLGSVNSNDVANQPVNAPFRVVLPDSSLPAPESRAVFSDGPDLLEALNAKGLLPESAAGLADGIATSETGELKMNGKEKTFSVVTPMTECFVLSPDVEMKGKGVSATNGDTNCVLCVSSMDGKPIVESQHLLVIHLTDVMNTGVRFSDDTHTILKAWGELPFLVRKGTCEVRIRCPSSGIDGFRVFAVSTGGKRLWQCPVEKTAEGIVLHASTIQENGACLAYEIVR